MRVSSSPALTITPRPVTGSPSATRSRNIFPSTFAATFPRTIFPSCFRPPRCLSCHTIPQPDRAALRTRRVNSASPSSAPTCPISAAWPPMRKWRFAFTSAAIPGDLAGQLLAILESPMLERQMAEHNFAAGIDMTMTSVVNNYLRWFRVNRSRRAILNRGPQPELPSESLNFRQGGAPPELRLQTSLLRQRSQRSDELRTLEPAPGLADSADCGVEPFTRRSSGS